jgi:hypothetical protein
MASPGRVRLNFAGLPLKKSVVVRDAFCYAGAMKLSQRFSFRLRRSFFWMVGALVSIDSDCDARGNHYDTIVLTLGLLLWCLDLMVVYRVVPALRAPVQCAGCSKCRCSRG